jgi:hypothetical protein
MTAILREVLPDWQPLLAEGLVPSSSHGTGWPPPRGVESSLKMPRKSRHLDREKQSKRAVFEN